MSKVLKVNLTGLVNDFVNRYLIWKDHVNLSNGHSDTVIEHSVNGIPCFHYTDVFGINNNDSDLVFIDCLTEGVHSRNFFDQYSKSKKYIIFSNGDWDKEFHNLSIDYELMHTLFFLTEMADTYNSPNRFFYYSRKVYNFNVEKPYSFVSTIGNVRPSRDLLVQKLTSMHPSRKFILRYSGQDLAQPSNHLDVINFNKGEFDPYTSIVEKYYYNVSQSLPIDMYNVARFNLVVETDIDYQNCFFLTEKTIKVLLSGMPFVSVNHPKFLSRLHALGFSTYQSLWDESYDDIVDYNQRIEKIVDLCDKLCDFDWDANREQLEFIQLKNQANFLNLNKTFEQEFVHFENIIRKYIK